MWCKVYGRKSRYLGDPDDLDVMAHQINPLLRVAAQEGIAVRPEDVIQEVGSAETIAARPHFRSVIAEIEAMPAEHGGVILVSETSRLSRGTMTERGRIMDQLIRTKIRVRTLSRWYDLSNADDELFFSFVSSVDRHEHRRGKQRSATWLEERTRLGKLPTGKAPYGYTWDKNEKQLRVSPAEFAVVERLFRDACATSIYRLARETGLPRSHIRDILHNPVYTGWPARHTQRYCWHSPDKPGNRKIPALLWKWPEQPGEYPPAVSREQFERVQQALLLRFTRRDKTDPANGWCRGIVQFEGIQGRVSLGSRRWRGQTVPVYGVMGDNRSLVACIARDVVHEAVEEQLLSALRQPEFLLIAYETYEEVERQRRGEAEGRGSQERDELARLRRQLVTLKLEETASGDPEDARAAVEAAREVKARIEGLKLTLTRYEPTLAPRLERAKLESLLSRLEANTEAVWRDLPDRDRQEMAETLLTSATVRITPRPHPEPWQREVVRFTWADWWVPYAEGLGASSIER